MTARDTSIAAADAIADAAPQLRARIYDEIRLRGGMTCDEVEAALGLKHQTASARVNELMNEGKIADSGKRRKTSSGARAIVWVPKDASTESPESSSSLVGKNLLMRGDAVECLRTLHDESVDLVVTDPAYESLEKHRRVGTTTRLKEWFEVFPNSRYPEFFAECYRVLRRDRHMYVFCDEETADILKPIGRQAGFKFWKSLVWNKKTIGMGYHYRNQLEFILFFEKGKRKLADLGIGDLLSFDRVRDGYPTEKPVELNEVLVRQSARPGEVVLDPFMGSGSAGIAALRAGCSFVGIDLSAHAFDLARQRLQKFDLSTQKEVDSRSATALEVVPGPSGPACVESETQSELTQPELDEQGETDMANLPKNLAERVGAAKTAGGGNYLQHGDYLLVIKKWEFQHIQDETIIHEFIVIDSKGKIVYEGKTPKQDEPNPIGSEASYAINFNGQGKLSAPSNARAVVLGLFGFKEGEVENSTVTTTLEDCCGDRQPASGMIIGCSTFPKEVKSRRGEYITGLNWVCVQRPGEGVNSVALAQERMRVLSAKGAEACVKLAMEHLKQSRGAITSAADAGVPAEAPGLPDETATTTQVAAAPPIPPAPPVPSPSADQKPWLAGWTKHPNNANFYYRGSEVKTEEQIRASWQ